MLYRVWGNKMNEIVIPDDIMYYSEIFAIKVESCENRAEFWCFLPLNVFGGTPSKICVHVITPASSHVTGKVSWGYARTPKVIGTHIADFKAKF